MAGSYAGGREAGLSGGLFLSRGKPLLQPLLQLLFQRPAHHLTEGDPDSGRARGRGKMMTRMGISSSRRSEAGSWVEARFSGGLCTAATVSPGVSREKRTTWYE
ncbi:hypothetical protein Pmani_000084 [Petrolisthes manimaculis]|uniref:Uncharacterized protein n=1 Tax=Petrolisthes manimaculis TaxID=1843537 RepID=A0AAE1UQP4_9EUCA|nr:hypothetical protein Pmani_000084 [Petrolisthes manimaculis]